MSEHRQAETNILKQGLTSTTTQVNAKTAVQFNGNRFKAEADQSLGREAQNMDAFLAHSAGCP